MKQTHSYARRVLIFLLIHAVLFGEHATAISNSTEAEDDAGHLVVMISTRLSDASGIGSGIIIGTDETELYIATARHTVYTAGQEAEHIEVRFRHAAEHSVAASLTEHSSTVLDVAVLSVPLSTIIGFDPEQIPFDRLGNPDNLKRGDQLFVMGQPNGQPWAMNIYADPLTHKSAERLYFQTSFLAPGMSGGALWNEHLDLVGMIRADRPPVGEAISIKRIIDQLEQWGYPVDLGKSGNRMCFTRVATGPDHSCALTANQEAYCWGEAGLGTLGTGISLGSERPRRVLGNHQFVSIDVGRDHSCGVDLDGKAWCWGSNSFGSLGIGEKLKKENWLSRTLPQPVSGKHRFTSISVSMPDSCAISHDGSPYCWGGLIHRKVAREPHRQPGALQFRSIHSAQQSACGLHADGRVYCWNRNFNDPTVSKEPQELEGGIRFKSIDVGGDYQPLGCGISNDGSTMCWGPNRNNELGIGKGHELESDYSSTPLRVSGDHEFASVSAGKYHVCALTEEGSAWCWGSNGVGELGNGSREQASVPAAVSGNLKFRHVSAGDGITCGSTLAGLLYCWGDIQGDETLEPRLVPGQDQGCGQK